MCKTCEYETCRACGKDFEKELGTGVTAGYPVCDLCPQIEEIEMNIEDLATDISVAVGLDRSALFGSLMAYQLRLSELKIRREGRL